MNKDMAQFLAEAERQGFVALDRTRGVMYLAPNGVDKVMVHRTPSDRRAFLNMVSAFRRAGMVWPAPQG